METQSQASPTLTGFTAQRGAWIAGLVCLAVFLTMYAFIGYSSGYGEVVDGRVVFNRDSLFSTMRADYKRDGGEWGFGYFVPLAAIGLFWFKRKELLATPVRPAPALGAGVLLFAFLVYWAGYRGEQKYFGYAAGQLLILGGIFWFLGWPWFRKIFWLWVLVGMMWPWRFLIGRISSPLQLIMAELTAKFLALFGVGTVRSGSAVMTDTRDPVTNAFINMDVDVACSGMRSLFALIMIGIVFAFLRLSTEWKRWVLMALVPAVAIAGNFVRMLILYAGSRAWGSEFAIGKDHTDMSGYHLFAGLMVFVVALILLTIIVEILNHGFRIFKRSKVVRKQVAANNP